MTRTTRWIEIVSLPLIAVLTAVLLVGAARAQAPVWGADDAAFAVQVRHPAGEDNGLVEISWDPPETQVTTYDLLRDRVEIGVRGDGKTTTSLVDPAPLSDGKPHTYEVRATYDGGQASLGAPSVQLDDGSRGCTITWTGGADNVWEDARNWAPYGAPNAAIGEPRVPGRDDVVCIDHNASSTQPGVVVTSPPSSVAGVIATNGDGANIGLGFVGGTLGVTGSFEATSIELEGGSLELGSGGTIVNSGEPAEPAEITYRAGGLDVGGVLDVGRGVGGLIVGRDNAEVTFSGGGQIQTDSLRAAALGSSADVRIQAIEGTTVVTDELVAGGASSIDLSVGTGGGNLVVDRVTVSDKGNTIDWTITEGTAGDPLYFGTGDASTLTVTDLGEADGGTLRADLNLFGTLVIDQDIATDDDEVTIDGEVTVGGAGRLDVGAIRPTAWKDIVAVRDFTIRSGAQVTIDGNLAVDDLVVSDAQLTVGGTVVDGFDAGTSLLLRSDAALTIADQMLIGTDWTVTVQDTATIAGPVANEGDLTIGFIPGPGGDVAAGQLTVDGSLTLDRAKDEQDRLRLIIAGQFDGDGVLQVDQKSDLDVTGAFTLGGILEVFVAISDKDTNGQEARVPEDFDRQLVDFAKTPAGAFSGIVVTDDVGERFEVDVRDDGIHLTAPGANAPEPPAWNGSDRLVVEAARLTADAQKASVQVGWPSPSNPDQVTGYRILRDGQQVGQAGAGDRSFVDNSALPDGAVHVYTLEGSSAAGVFGQLGDPGVLFDGLDDGCTLTWTGAVGGGDDSWAEARNWGPYGVVGAELGPVRAPTEDDVACILHARSAPGGVTVTRDEQRAGTVVGRAPGTGLDIVSGDLTVLDAFEMNQLDVTGGRIALLGERSDPTIPVNVVPGTGQHVTLSGGTVEIADQLFVNNIVATTSGTTTPLVGPGELNPGNLVVNPNSTLIGQGGVTAFLRGSFTIRDATMTEGPGGASVLGSITGRGDSRIEWTADGKDGREQLVNMFPGAELTLTDVGDLSPGDTVWEAGRILFSGDDAKVFLDEPLTVMGGDVSLRGAEGGLFPAGGDVNLAGVQQVANLTLRFGQRPRLDGDLATRDVSLVDASLTVPGTLGPLPGTTLQRVILEGSVLTVGEPLNVATGGRITPRGAPSRIVGNVVLGGSLDPGFPFRTTGALTIEGDLAINGGRIDLLVNGPTPVTERDQLVVTDRLALGGMLVVDIGLGANPAGTFDLLLIDGPTSGNFAEIDLNGDNAADYEIEVRTDGVHLIANSDDQQSTFAAGDSLVVAEARYKGDAGGAVLLDWPTPSFPENVTEYRIRRDGTVIGTVGTNERQYLDKDIADDEAYRYSLEAVSAGGSSTIGDPVVRFVGAEGGCTLSWTGSVDGSWDEARNWASYGEDGADLGAPRIPGPEDTACINHDEQNYGGVTVTAAPTSVGSVVVAGNGLFFRGSLPFTIDGGTLQVNQDLTAEFVTVSGGGVLVLKRGGTIAKGAISGGPVPELLLDGGTVDVADVLDVNDAGSGVIEFGESGVSTISGGGRIETGLIDVDPDLDVQVAATGGTTLAANTLELGNLTRSSRAQFTSATAAGILAVNSITAFGTATNILDIEWLVTSRDDGGDVRLFNRAGTLAIDDLADLSGLDGTLHSTDISTGGDLRLEEAVTTIDGDVQIFGAGTLKVGGSTQSFAGINAVRDLTVRGGGVVNIEGSLGVDTLTVGGADANVTISDGLVDGFDPGVAVRLDDGATLDSSKKGLSLTDDDTLLVTGQAEIIGDVTNNGTITLSEVIPFEEAFHGALTVTGDLTQPTTGRIEFFVDGTEAGERSDLVVTGTLSAAGTLALATTLKSDPVRTFDLQIATATTTGNFVPVQLSGENSTDYRVETRADGVHLTARGDTVGSDDCSQSIQPVRGITVFGCWADDGDGVYRTSANIAAQNPVNLPAIGGLTFTPQGSTELILDIPNLTLHTELSGGSPGTGELEITIPVIGGDSGARALGDGDTIGGVIPGIDWNLAEGVLFDIAEFLGIDLDIIPTLEINDDAQWVLDVTAKLPALLDQFGVDFELPFGDTGIQIAAITAGGLAVVLGEIAQATGLDFTYLGGEVWRLVNTAQDALGLDGTFDYSGDTMNGSLQVTNLTFAGLGPIDVLLTVQTVNGVKVWTGQYDAGGTQATVRLATTGSSLSGGSIEFTDLDIGLATVDGLKVTRQTNGTWSFTGTVTTIDGTSDASGEATFGDNGVLLTATLTVNASFGPLGSFQPLNLSFTGDSRLGVYAGLPEYSVSGVIVSGGRISAIDGTLIHDGNAIQFARIDLFLELGELATIDARLHFDGAAGVWTLSESGEGEGPAQLTCGGTTSDISASLVLEGGRPSTGFVEAEQLCFGPEALENVRFEVSEGVIGPNAGKVYNLTATITNGGESKVVTGFLRIAGGRFVTGDLSLPALTLGGLATIPATMLQVAVEGQDQRWTLKTAPSEGEVLADFELVFRNGSLRGADLLLGTLDEVDERAPSAFTWGEWIDATGLRLQYNAEDGVYVVDGRLRVPDATFSGLLDFNDGGDLVVGSLILDDIEVGSIGTLNLNVDFVSGQTFALSGEVTGGSAAEATIQGELVFDGTTLQSAFVNLGALEIGELGSIDGFVFLYDRGAGPGSGTWAAAGAWTAGGGGEPVEIAGSLVFDAGVLVEADLELQRLVLGPVVLEEFTLSLDRQVGDGNDVGTYALSALVRGPATGEEGGASAELEEISGSLTLVNGTVTAFALTITNLEFGSLFVVEDVDLAYSRDAATGSATLTGSGSLRTAANTGVGKVSVEVVVKDGVLQTARLEAELLHLGGPIRIDDFVASYEGKDGLQTCPGLQPSDAGAELYTLSGTVSGTTIDGCLGLEQGRIVAMRLALGELALGELATISDVEATYQSSQEYAVDTFEQVGNEEVAGPTIGLRRTRLSLSGTVTAAGESTSLTGVLAVQDGGLEFLQLNVDAIGLSDTVRLEDLTFEYDATGRFDGTSLTSITVNGSAVHQNGTTTVAGSVTYRTGGDAGKLASASIDISNLGFGPVTIDLLKIQYKGAANASSWVFDGQISVGDGGELAQVVGSATITDGRLTAGDLTLGGFSVGELARIDQVAFAFGRKGGADFWQGSGTVTGPEGNTATASVSLTISPGGRLEAGRIQIAGVRWGGLFTLTNFVASVQRQGDVVTWQVSAQLAVSGGNPTSVSGSLTLSDGVTTAGELHLADVRIGDALTIKTLDLAASRTATQTTWAATIVAESTRGDIDASGSMVWSGGSLQSADLAIGSAQIGEMLTLQDVRISYQNGVEWAASGSVVHEDGTTSLAGVLSFTDGRLTGGAFTATDIAFGPLKLASFSLGIQSQVNTGTIVQNIGNVCGVPDASTGGTRYAFEAVVRSGDGDTTSVGGRFRIVDRRLTDGIICGSNIQIADFVLLESATLSYREVTVGSQRTANFAGSAQVKNVDRGTTSAGSFSFSIRERQLQSATVTADNLKLGELLDLRSLNFSYNRSVNGTAWSFGAALNQPGQNSSSIAGSLVLEDGVIVSGSLDVNELRFGDAFVLQNLSISFRGRKALTNTVRPLGTGGLPPLTTNNGCEGSPIVPGPISGTATTGVESSFSVSASVLSNGQTYAAGGALSFANGRLQSFDITIGCIPLGGVVKLSDVRVLYTNNQEFRIQGRLDKDGQSTSVEGRATFNNGRLTGGSITVRDLPLGAIEVKTFSLSLGQNGDGTSTWGIAVEVEDSEGNVAPGGGGSITIRDGKIVGGTLELPEIPVADLLKVTNLNFTFDTSIDGLTTLSATGGIKTGTGGTAVMTVGVTYLAGGGLQAANFNADSGSLFGAVPVGLIAISFDRATNKWAGEINIGFGGGNNNRALPTGVAQAGVARPGNAGPASRPDSFGTPGFRLAFEITDGKLTSGLFGFDADGDGNADEPDPDGNAAASGAGVLSDIPLKAFYIKYCSDEAAGDPAIQFCPESDGDTWEGRLAIEFPTSAAPTLAASLRISNGKFAYTSLEIGFGRPGIPLFPGVFLQSLSASLQVDPQIEFSGGMGIGILNIAEVGADIEFNERPDLDTFQGSTADYEAMKYLQFVLRVRIDLFDLPIRAEAFVDVQTRGYLAMGGGVNVDLIRKKNGEAVLSIAGGVEGTVFDGGDPRITAFIPGTNRPITGASFQIRAFLSGTVVGFNLATIEVVVNPYGALGCIDTFLGDIGAGLKWSTGEFKMGCNTDDYEIAGIDSEFAATPRSTFGVGARAVEDETLFFDVAEGEEYVGLVVNGADGGDPRVALVAPDGARVGPGDDDDPMDDGYYVAAVDGGQLFQLLQPQSGRWSIEVQPGSATIEDVNVFQNLEPAQVDGTITPATGGRFALDWTKVLDGDKQEVEIHERIDGQTSASLGYLRGASGRILFGPSGPGEAGTRELVAVVTNDGMPGEEISLGTYEAPEATSASVPRNVVVTEIPGGARVTWDRPETNGGRRIESYKVFSNTGFSTVVESDQFSAEVEIPGMTVGEEVPVAVEAFTIGAWGDRAVGFFESTQVTGLQYLVPGQSGTRVLLDGFGDAQNVIRRLAGETRVETAVEVSRDTFEPGVDTVWIATAGNFPDALAAGPAAVERGGPILLVTDELPDVTRAEIERLQPDRVVVMGGPVAVSEEVFASLGEVSDDVTRFGGADRFETAAITSAATFEPGVEVAYIATGRNFPDALTGGVAAGRVGAPVLLTERTSVPEATLAELKRLVPDRVVVLGGQVAVANGALVDLTEALPGTRLEVVAGETRYDTAAMIAASSFDSADEAWIATGTNFPDALAAVPAAVADGAPLLLVDDGVPAPTAGALASLGASRLTILGGPEAVPVAVESALAAALGVR